MIAIINISANPKPTGPHRYRVQINRHIITEFEHNREDGLAVCLEKAAKAVEAHQPCGTCGETPCYCMAIYREITEWPPKWESEES